MLLSMGFPALDAQALALGRVNVQSALGEPLRAEIDVPDINADEAATLQATVAGPDAFKAAGLEYNAVLSSVKITLQKRPDGRSYLRLTSDRPMNEPFVDLILQANWAAGRLVRDYTMLFDPPNLRAATAPSTITAPIVTSAAPRSVVTSRPIESTPAPLSAPPPVYITEEAAPKRTSASNARAARASKPEPIAVALPGPGEITVKKGNTAAQLAARYKPAGVSLDQMLVAMLSTNPDAFVSGNVNRLKAGAVLDMPTTAAVADGTSSADARRTIVAQSKDFNAFRRRLAQSAPSSTAPTASRKASGTVQAQVQERNSNAGTPDKLTLSKAASAAKSAKEEIIARDKQAKDTAERTATLTKNMQDLAKLDTATSAISAATKPAGTTASAAVSGAKAVAGAAAAVAAGAVGAALNVPGPAAASSAAKLAPTAPTLATVTAAVTATAAAMAAKSAASTPVAAASAAVAVKPASSAASAAVATKLAASAAVATTALASAAKASTVTTAPVAPADTKPKAPVSVATAPTPVAETSLVDSLMSNPVTLPLAGGFVALLAGFGAWRWRQRKKNEQKDSSFLESRLQPDSFFGASGGQRIDTNNSAAGAVSVAGGSSSMVYSPSQLDAAGDVDPVAEADVYLAYGRDLQAEEILKEALRMQPSRTAVHAKLLEIYAKRRDTKAFDTLAKELNKISGGQGPEWETARAMGRELDPANALYQGGDAPRASAPAPTPARSGTTAASAGAVAAAAVAVSTVSMAAHAGAPADPDVDFDLDLDFAEVDHAPASMAKSAPDPYMSTTPIPKAAPFKPAADPHFDIATEDNHNTTAMGLGPDGEDPMDFGFDAPALPVIAASARDTVKLSGPDMDSFSNSLSFSAKPPVKVAAVTTAPMEMHPVAAPSNALEFDFGDLSLDLPASGAGGASAHAASAAVDAGVTGNPLETKLALAQEFREIGDNDGARAMAEEVAAEAKGALKARAQRMVADLS